MESRLLFFTPKGPLCFVDYNSIMEGRTILNRIRQIAGSGRQGHEYQFTLFRKIKDRLVSIDEYFMPRFDLPSLEFFVETAFSKRS
ncbi:hypothetical protein [Chitinophaga cymbidii]|nr:hypothetical protein [Chitinophaga cymbidii]